MSIIKTEDSRKWIYGLVALFSLIVGFLSKRFLDQLSIWFDLESKVSSIGLVSQGLGAFIGIGLFLYVLNNEKTSAYLNEVFDELVRVVWPSKDATVKITIGLVVALTIVAGLFVTVDFIFKKILSVVY